MANGSLRVIKGCPPGRVKALTSADMKKFDYIRMESLVQAMEEIEAWAKAVREVLQAFRGNEHIELKNGKAVAMKVAPRASTGTAKEKKKTTRKKTTRKKAVRRKTRG